MFLHYARMSGVSTLREATRLRFVGLQALARDSMLDTRDFDLNAIGRVLAGFAEDSTSRRSSSNANQTKDLNPEAAALRLEEFFQLLVQLSFCWCYPRHGHALFDAPRPTRRSSTRRPCWESWTRRRRCQAR